MVSVRTPKADATKLPNGLPEYDGKTRPPFPPDVEELLAELTDKQVDFLLYYTLGPPEFLNNGTQCAIAAGYSEKSAAQQASYFLNEHAKVRTVIRLLKNLGRNLTQVSFEDYIRMLVQQANSWLDEDGMPKEKPVVSQGAIVKMEFLLRDKEGNVIMEEDELGKPRAMTVWRPVIEQWRPNSSNTRALELIGKALAYIDTPKAPGNLPGSGDKARANAPRAMPALTDGGKLGQFLDKLPAPDLARG